MATPKKKVSGSYPQKEKVLKSKSFKEWIKWREEYFKLNNNYTPRYTRDESRRTK
jgi:hypothetical protein